MKSAPTSRKYARYASAADARSTPGSKRDATSAGTASTRTNDAATAHPAAERRSQPWFAPNVKGVSAKLTLSTRLVHAGGAYHPCEGATRSSGSPSP